MLPWNLICPVTNPMQQFYSCFIKTWIVSFLSIPYCSPFFLPPLFFHFTSCLKNDVLSNFFIKSHVSGHEFLQLSSHFTWTCIFCLPLLLLHPSWLQWCCLEDILNPNSDLHTYVYTRNPVFLHLNMNYFYNLCLSLCRPSTQIVSVIRIIILFIFLNMESIDFPFP